MISFIVPAKNEEKYIRDCLESIQSQNVEKEIIVVDGASKDKTVAIAQEFADCIIPDVKGIGRARHKGAKKAEGDYMAFIDADTVLKSKYSRKMLDFVEKNDLVAASSDFKMDGARSKVVQSVGNLFFDRMDPVLLPGFNTFVKADVYHESKGFEALPGEDLQFSREIAKRGDTGILDEKLVHNSGRRIRRMGLTGTLVYYGMKESGRRAYNIHNKKREKLGF